MSRPSTRRAMRRAGVERPPRKTVSGPPPPLIYLSEETGVEGPLDFAAVFGRRAPVVLEIGSGKARFLLAEAQARPERNHLGLELQPDYAAIARARASRLGLTNVRFERLDGRAFVERRLHPASLAEVHIYFPDPWPKKRHRKRRLVDSAFATAVARALEPGGPLRVASDDAAYFAEITRLLDSEPLLEHVAELEAGPWSSGTHYELKFQKEGRSIGKAVWRRRL